VLPYSTTVNTPQENAFPPKWVQTHIARLSLDKRKIEIIKALSEDISLMNCPTSDDVGFIGDDEFSWLPPTSSCLGSTGSKTYQLGSK
jgi:hypothetical protein